jgi:hypothetical protein
MIVIPPDDASEAIAVSLPRSEKRMEATGCRPGGVTLAVAGAREENVR